MGEDGCGDGAEDTGGEGDEDTRGVMGKCTYKVCIPISVGRGGHLCGERQVHL